jgi:uncharacterized protein YjdB
MNRKIVLLPLFILGFLFSAKAQCPSNIDFELGLTPGWIYNSGSVATGPAYTWSGTGIVAGYHDWTTGPGLDPYGLFPTVSPGGGLHSLKILHDLTGAPASRGQYQVHVPTTSGVWSLIYRYAAVLNDPGTSHTLAEKPRMTVRAYDSATGVTVVCDSYTYIAGGSVPGFLLSATPATDGTLVYYKPWTLGNMKFPGLGGHTVTVEVITNGCSLTGHWGYGYFDMTCGFSANSLITCASGTTTLAGPDGFQGYNWMDSATFTTSYGSFQSVAITSPTTTTTYAVILTPYAGYGCTDTLYTKVVPSQLHVNASNDTSICAGVSLNLFAGASSPYTPITYLWGPSTGLSCVTCANPVATPTVSTNYYVTATDNQGCQASDTVHITVFPNPGAITGPTSVCLGQTVSLSETPPGGVWTSSSPGTASIGSTTGIVTGVTIGTATITYTLGVSCRATRSITVNPLPSIITGNASICIGSSTTLFDSVGPGTWSGGGIVSVLTVGTSTGIVTGLSAGVTSVTYTMTGTGCFRTRLVTVNATPSPISVLPTVCVGATSVATDATPGGTWSASPLAYGSITPTTGVITGLSAGVLTITYTSPTSCSITATVTVLPIPGVISGPHNVCIGDSILLTDATPGGSWITGSADVYIPDITVGYVVGQPIVGSGVAIISYTVGTSTCPALYSVTVNPYTSPISGATSLCIGQTTVLSDADPGTWSSSNPAVATIGSTSGLVTGLTTGSTVITFINTLGCKATMSLTVNPMPAPITGLTTLCVGTSITLSDATPGGTWSTGGVIHATVNSFGVVTGSTVGTQLITYTSSLSCSVTYTVTVQTTPPPIIGVLSVCQGLTTVLTDGIAGGIWSITPTTIAGIVSTVASATVTGVNPGTAIVTYQLGVGCSTSATVTVNPMPGPIVPGSPTVCVGSSTLTLSDPTSPGGTWSPISGTNANIGPLSGIVTGITSGLQIFTYTSSTGCIRMTTVNVNPIPLPIAGPTSVCQGATITLSDPTGGGTFTSLNIPIATITLPGVLTGVTPGTATIVYKITGTGCATARVVTVNPIPGVFAITATGTSFCAGGAGVSIGLSGSAIGVNYKIYIGGLPSAAPALAGSGGILNFGLQTTPGVYTIVGTFPASGCGRTMTGSVTVNVNPVPVITGPTALCVGTTIPEVSSIPLTNWTSSNPANASVGFSSGIVSGLTTGTSTIITATAPTGCTSQITVNVSPSPGPIIGPSTVCVADSILLSDMVVGGTWTSSSSFIASVGSLSGYVTGNSSGTAIITYSLGTGCTQTKTVTVNPMPGAITGTMVICQGASTTLHPTTTPGSWSVAPGSLSLASVGSTSGTVTANITGSSTPAVAVIYYTSPVTGCHNWASVTINPLPAPIGGSLQVCQGLTTALSDATPFGTWSISATTFANINPSGVVSGVLPGTATVTYTALGCGTSAIVTVNPLPGTITGTTHVCQGMTTTVSATPAGGTWTASPSSLLSIFGSGVITGGSGTGIGSVTYTLSTGCLRSTPVTVNLTPLPVVNPGSLCVGSITAVLTDPTPGGVWSSSNLSIATIGAGTGILVPGFAGSTTISYTVGTCAATSIFTVLNHPALITGTLNVCVGGTTTLYDTSFGGLWSSGSPSYATIGATTGIVTGISAGTVIMTYGGSGGCFSIAPVVVNPILPITGDSVVCIGQTIHLTDAALGGHWTSSDVSVATVGYTTGVVTGVAASTATITYTLSTGCTVNKIVTVNALPLPITGPSAVCVNQFVSLADPVLGGTWSSSNTLIGSVDAGGVVTGMAAGAVTISYTLSSTTGCAITKAMTVNALPNPITGPSNMCLTADDLFTDAGLGNWTSTLPSVATINFTTGMAHAIAIGTTDIVYTLLTTGCFINKTLNVNNPPTPIFITAPAAVVCVGQSIDLFDTTGTGAWTSSDSGIVHVDPATGHAIGMNMGVATITYSTGSGCNATIAVTVNQTPSFISGIANVCVGATATLTSFPAGGVWSSSTTDATIDSVSGLVTGVSAGSSTIAYTLATGCAITRTEIVNPTPAAITGINTVCVAGMSALSDADAGGTWASSAPSIGSIDAVGVVTGLVPGITTISYTIPSTTCPAILQMTVNNVPGPITGTLTVCEGQTTLLSNSVPLGTWTSTSLSTATVNSTSGLVTGVAAGVADITYTLGAGCSKAAQVTVNPIPASLIGGDSVCQGQFLFFADPTPMGTWSSSSTAVATISPLGVMSSLTAGTTTISYLVNGCAATHPVRVDAQPTAITGNTNVCFTGLSTLSDAVPGGVWSSSVPTVATITSTGVVFGAALGSSVITYKILPGGCFVNKVVNVVPLPVKYTVTGGGSYCTGDTGVVIGLLNSSTGVNYILYQGITATGAFPGTGTALSFGPQTMSGTYSVIGTTISTGCSATMLNTVNVTAAPTFVPAVSISASPNDTVCTGTTVMFTPTATNGGLSPTYQWSVNGINVATSNTYSFIPANGDTVGVTMMSSITCPSPATGRNKIGMTVQAFANPVVNAIAHPGDTVCVGTAATFTAAPVYGGSAPTYIWMKDGVVSGTGGSFSYVPVNNDVVYVILHSNHPCRLTDVDTSSNIVMTTVTPVLPVVSIHVTPNTLVSAGQKVTMTAGVINGGTAPTYQWFMNGVPVAGATNATYTSDSLKTPEADSFSCQVTSHDFCPITGYSWVYIQVSQVSVGQVAANTSDISVVPNPNKGDFMIKGSLGLATDQEVSLEITDVLGQIVYKDKLTARNGKLNEHVTLGSKMANGMYILSVKTSSDSKVFHLVIEQ